MPGMGHRVAHLEHGQTVTRLELNPKGRRKLSHRPGQWAVPKIQLPGLREPHPFSIASSPARTRVRFIVRDLGDRTRRLRNTDVAGADVAVEGPYGRFRPFRGGRPVLRVAGGVGITPFLRPFETRSAVEPIPQLFYAVRSEADAVGLDELRRAEEAGRLHLYLFSSAEGRRISPRVLRDVFGHGGRAGYHVAVCGPADLVHTVAAVARSLGADRVEHEDFDIRHGFGPGVSRELEDAVTTSWGKLAADHDMLWSPRVGSESVGREGGDDAGNCRRYMGQARSTPTHEP